MQENKRQFELLGDDDDRTVYRTEAKGRTYLVYKNKMTGNIYVTDNQAQEVRKGSVLYNELVDGATL